MQYYTLLTLQSLNYAVFGLGDSLYAREHYNAVARDLDRFLAQLSANRFHPLGLGDENEANSKHGSTENDFAAWSESLLDRLVGNESSSVKGTSQERTSDLEDEESFEDEEDEESEFSEENEDFSEEDMGEGDTNGKHS